MKLKSILLLTLILSFQLTASTVVYVKSDGSTTADGLSWSNAVNLDRARVLVNYYNNLSSPVETELWLKSGVYNLSSAFLINLRINIYGGFVGIETLREQRNWYLNQTILNQTSSSMVIWGNTSDNVQLDGLILQGGRPTGAGGCGQVAQGTSLRNCIVRNNKATTSSGAFTLFAVSGSTKKIVFENCLIVNNESATFPPVINAGAVPVDFINCTVANNLNLTTGSTATIATSGTFNMYNCIIFGNKNGANPAKAVGTNSGKILKNNSWDVAATDGVLANNILLNTSPFNSATSFVGAANGTTQLASSIESADFKLKSGSACINSGDSSYVTTTFDLSAQSRLNGNVDMGCYENQSIKLAVLTQKPHIVGYNNAEITGSVNSIPDGGIVQHGHCWNTTGLPTMIDGHTELGTLSQLGNFTSQISGLNTFTTYYIRSYIKTNDTIVYSKVVNILTQTMQLKLAGVFGNGMVLQQKTDVEVWGWSEPFDTINIASDWGATTEAVVDANGRWRTKLRTPAAISGDNTGHQIVFSGKNNVVTLTDVLIGDVWLFRGQSNMGYTMWATSNTRGVIDAESEIAQADYPQIRLYKAPQNPQSEEVEYVSASWSKCTPDVVKFYSAIAYYFSRKIHLETGIPVGVVLTAYGSSTCEAWTKKEVLLSDSILKKKYLDPFVLDPGSYSPIQTSPTLLYNGMVSPIKKFSAKGLVWYQGEGNSSQPDTYPLLWSSMVNSFRNEWDQGNLPVYFVQLPAYSLGASWHVFRNAQTTLLTLPNTGMAVSVDLQDPNPADIHPMVKKPIAERLALWALAKDYGKNIMFTGPVFDQMTISGSKVIVNFQQNSVGSGLKTTDNSDIREFTVAGADKIYYAATATIVGETIELVSNQVSQPLYVRYAYSPTPDPNLVNNAGLPAVPFSTDTWNYNIKISTDPNIATELKSTSYLNYKRLNNGIEFENSRVDKVTSIRLFDLYGRLIYFENPNAAMEQIFIPIRNKGGYLLSINFKNRHYSDKIIY